jgi:hypothetical protein
MTILGINELGGGSRLVKISANNTKYSIFVPPSIRVDELNNYLKKEVSRDVRFYTKGS